MASAFQKLFGAEHLTVSPAAFPLTLMGVYEGWASCDAEALAQRIRAHCHRDVDVQVTLQVDGRDDLPVVGHVAFSYETTLADLTLGQGRRPIHAHAAHGLLMKSGLDRGDAQDAPVSGGSRRARSKHQSVDVNLVASPEPLPLDEWPKRLRQSQHRRAALEELELQQDITSPGTTRAAAALRGASASTLKAQAQQLSLVGGSQAPVGPSSGSRRSPSSGHVHESRADRRSSHAAPSEGFEALDRTHDAHATCHSDTPNVDPHIRYGALAACLLGLSEKGPVGAMNMANARLLSHGALRHACFLAWSDGPLLAPLRLEPWIGFRSARDEDTFYLATEGHHAFGLPDLAVAIPAQRVFRGTSTRPGGARFSGGPTRGTQAFSDRLEDLEGPLKNVLLKLLSRMQQGLLFRSEFDVTVGLWRMHWARFAELPKGLTGPRGTYLLELGPGPNSAYGRRI